MCPIKDLTVCSTSHQKFDKLFVRFVSLLFLMQEHDNQQITSWVTDPSQTKSLLQVAMCAVCIPKFYSYVFHLSALHVPCIVSVKLLVLEWVTTREDLAL